MAKDQKTIPKRPGFWTSLGRSQIASMVATLADNSIYAILNEIFLVWYAAAVAMGAFCGAVIHFTLGRYWAFIAIEGKFQGQAFRYGLVALSSLLLNTGAVVLLTENGLHRHVSKAIVAVSVGLFFNYPLHRYFVFSRHKSHFKTKVVNQ